MSNGKQVIIFNGPPGSGKDHACDLIMFMIGDDCHHLRFKDHLFECVTTLFNIDLDEFMELYNNRETKEKPTCVLRGLSPREAMIFVSETVIKPNFGNDYFGLCVAENIDYGLTVISDGGFVEEIGPVYDECEGNMLIVQIHREGYDFSNDSRGYINQFKDVHIVKLYNHSSLANFEVSLANITTAFIDGVWDTK